MLAFDLHAQTIRKCSIFQEKMVGQRQSANTGSPGGEKNSDRIQASEKLGRAGRSGGAPVPLQRRDRGSRPGGQNFS